MNLARMVTVLICLEQIVGITIIQSELCNAWAYSLTSFGVFNPVIDSLPNRHINHVMNTESLCVCVCVCVCVHIAVKDLATVLISPSGPLDGLIR